jgi:predicted nucleic acid-binding protein
LEDKIILLDTDFAFELLHKNKDAESFIEQNNFSVITVSSVTFFEMIKSCIDKTQLNNLQKQLPKFFYPIPIETEISNLAGNFLNEYHLSHDLKINDALIAASAVFYNVEFATCNFRHFQFIPFLQLAKHNVIPVRKGGSLFT